MRQLFILAPKRCAYSGLATMLDMCELANRYTASVYSDVDGPRGAGLPLLLTADGGPIAFSDGRKLAADGAFDFDEAPAGVFVAANAVETREELAIALDEQRELSERLTEYHRHGAFIAGAGTAIFYLAQSGLLDGLDSAQPAQFPDEFHRRFPKVGVIPGQAIVRGARISTAAGFAHIPRLVLGLYEDVFSDNLGDVLRKLTLIEDPAPYEMKLAAQFPPVADPVVRRGQLWLQANFAKSCSISDLAHTLAVSPKTLARRFHGALGMSPQQYLVALRVETAKIQLIHTRRRIDQIANLVGYTDVAYFRQKFKDLVGLTPAEYRRGEGGRS